MSDNHHRQMVGGLWDEMGQLQFDFLVRQGLSPEHRLLDIACGCLRGGVHFVRYLQPGNYYGVDVNAHLLERGRDELASAGIAERLPPENLVCEGEFNFAAFRQMFHYALAQSLFTHLPLNDLRLCLSRLAGCMHPGGKFYVTFFEIPESNASVPYSTSHGEVTTFAAKDPFHYYYRDLEYAARGLPWKAVYIGNWMHPRNQKIMYFQRAAA